MLSNSYYKMQRVLSQTFGSSTRLWYARTTATLDTSENNFVSQTVEQYRQIMDALLTDMYTEVMLTVHEVAHKHGFFVNEDYERAEKRHLNLLTLDPYAHGESPDASSVEFEDGAHKFFSNIINKLSTCKAPAQTYNKLVCDALNEIAFVGHAIYSAMNAQFEYLQSRSEVGDYRTTDFKKNVATFCSKVDALDLICRTYMYESYDMNTSDFEKALELGYIIDQSLSLNITLRLDEIRDEIQQKRKEKSHELLTTNVV